MHLLAKKNREIQIRLQSTAPKQQRSFFVRMVHAVLWLPYAIGLALLSIGGGLVWLVSTVCHAAGLAVLWPPKTIARALVYVWHLFLRDIAQTFGHIPRMRARAGQAQFAYGLALFFAVSVSCFALVSVGTLLAEGLHIKGRVLGQATNAVSKLEQGKDKLASENLEEAQSKFELALRSFQDSQKLVGDTNVLIQATASVLPAGKDAQNLLRAGSAGSEAAVHLTKLFAALKALHMDATGFHADNGGESIVGVQAEFAAVRQAIHEAATSSSKVNSAHVPEGARQKFEQARTELLLLDGSLETVGSALDVIVALSSGHKHILVLLQNSNELRPSGGFPGTYGAFDVENGTIVKQTISSIYDLDGQLVSKYTPPLPLFAVNNRWYMRDSNWFASFPESAEVLSTFYEEEAHVTPDVVVAITPQLATNLLKLTGPISVPGYTTPLDADNFIEVTQVETSLQYDKEENKPKKMLSEFFPIFLNKLASFPKEDMPSVLLSLQKSFASKDIQMYARDGVLAEKLRSLSWDGRLVDTARDYLSIVSTNLGGTKTDLAMSQSVQLKTAVSSTGVLTNTLTIVRSNPLPHVKGLENKDFMRIYVPEGSKLISSKGFSYMDLDVKYGTTAEPHPKVAEWESHTVKEVASGMLVGQEAGKTFFGNWVNLEGGQRQTLEIVYELPFTIEALDRVSLAVQKQAGANPYVLSYGVDAPGRTIVWATDSTAAGHSLTKELDIDRDRFFGTVMQAQ